MSFRRSVTVALGSLGFVCCPAGPALAAGPVVPTVQCVFHNADGTYTGVFGYTNSSSSPLVLPVGGSNNFAPKPANRGQPTAFQPGSHPSILVVTFSGTNLAWNLDTNNVHATNTSPQCASDPVLAMDTGSLAAIVALVAAAAVGAARLGRRARR